MITIINSHFAQFDKSGLFIYSWFFCSMAFASCSLISMPFTKYRFISESFVGDPKAALII